MNSYQPIRGLLLPLRLLLDALLVFEFDVSGLQMSTVCTHLGPAAEPTIIYMRHIRTVVGTCSLFILFAMGGPMHYNTI